MCAQEKTDEIGGKAEDVYMVVSCGNNGSIVLVFITIQHSFIGNQFVRHLFGITYSRILSLFHVVLASYMLYCASVSVIIYAPSCT